MAAAFRWASSRTTTTSRSAVTGIPWDRENPAAFLPQLGGARQFVAGTLANSANLTTLLAGKKSNVIPGVADLNNGFANWQTDVRLFNPSANIVKATLTFYSQGGGAPQSKDVSLAPNQVQTFDSALHQFFGVSNDGGALHISTTATTPLVATCAISSTVRRAV